MNLKEFGNWFWNDEFWLPPNVTWNHFKTEQGTIDSRYATSRDLIWPIPLAFGIIVIRYVIENLVFRPIGRKLGLKAVRRRHPGRKYRLFDIVYSIRISLC